MMIGVKVKRKTIHNVEKGLKQGYEDGLIEFLTVLETSAKLLAPVDTGTLRTSIFKKIINKLKEKTIGIVALKLSYGRAQEEGTSKMQAANSGEGFLKPAAELNRNKVGPIFGKHIRGGIRSN